MKKLLTLSFIVSMFLFASCEKTVTNDPTKWQIDNEAIFKNITNNSEYKKIESFSKAGHIMYKVLEEGVESDVNPLFNSRVNVNYTGWFKRYDWNKGDEYPDDNGNSLKNKFVFDTTLDTNSDEEKHKPRPFNVNEVIDGFTTALQHMTVGDKWEIWIPWNMGYGGGSTYNPRIAGDIPEYTTLVFEIELVEIIKL